MKKKEVHKVRWEEGAWGDKSDFSNITYSFNTKTGSGKNEKKGGKKLILC